MSNMDWGTWVVDRVLLVANTLVANDAMPGIIFSSIIFIALAFFLNILWVSIRSYISIIRLEKIIKICSKNLDGEGIRECVGRKILNDGGNMQENTYIHNGIKCVTTYT